jgi:ribosome biogenesis GTPase
MNQPHNSEDWIDKLEDTFERGSAPNRPRSKRRPRHENAVAARVLGVDRGRYSVVALAAPDTVVRANKARELGRDSIVVGDLVDVVGDTTGAEGSLARIVRLHPRDNVLRRSADDSDVIERVIVANVDQLLMVVAARDPEPRPRLIDRYVVAALDAGITPLLCVTKTDLASASELASYVDGLDIDVFALRTDGAADDFERLREALRNKTTVAVGHSGVGKSTLVNRLAPMAGREVGSVNLSTGRGRHTSSSSRAIVLPGGGWIIDTPGVRSFGLGHVSTEALDRGFPDLADFLSECPKGCRHAVTDTDCGMRGAASDPSLAEGVRERIESLLRLHQAASSSDDHTP